MGTDDNGEGFARRWSRLKTERRQAAKEPTAEVPAVAAPPEPEPEPVVDPESLPDPETLGKDGDYTVFLQKGVPDLLRQKALRALWRSDPVLACLDGLNDYDEDYNAVETATDVIKTAYRAGKGYLRDEDEVEKTQVTTAPDPDPPEPPETLRETPTPGDEKAESPSNT